MNEEIEHLCTQEILFFLDQYNIRNDQGEPLDFKDHPYLWDIYDDWSPTIAVRKAAQIGFSTTANIKALWLAKNRGMDIIYSLPSASDIKDFVSGKTNRLIDNNAIFQAWTADKDSIEQKRVGSNVIYFKGTWTERAAIATPADLYISDETDRSKQEIVQQYQTRLQHSKFGWRWYFSNPSAPGHGVDRYWQDSDQKHWFVHCDCNQGEDHGWQYLTMRNIVQPENGLPYFGCRMSNDRGVMCKRELNRRKGQWVRKWTNKDISGYWISSLMSPLMSASQVLAKQKDYTEEQFANFVLGEPYIGKGNVLTRQSFMQNIVRKTNPQDKKMIIGVDTGVGINYICGNEYGLFAYDKVKDYEPIRAILKRFPDSIAIIDQGGDIIGPRKLREEFKNRVFLCFFAADRKNDELVRWNKDDGTVVADRNKVIQLVVDELTEKRIPMYGKESEWEEVWEEWKGMYRTSEENSLGVDVFKWNKPASGRADYPFCYVYWRIGMSEFMNDKAAFIDPNPGTFAFQGSDHPTGAMFLPKFRM